MSGPGFVGLDHLLDPEIVASLSAPVALRPTGFDPLDQVLSGGFAPEELVVVGGIPGVGKSVATVQWARNLAHTGQNVLLACYEHSELIVMAQLLLIELGEASASVVDTVKPRHAIDDMIGGRATWEETVKSDDKLGAAAERLARYAANITVLDREGRGGGFDPLRAAVMDHGADVLVIDHLQKVCATPADTAVRAKELAVATGCTVLATTVVSDDGVAARRLRPEHLVDAAMVTHEADIEIVLNDKLPIVSRNHSAFDSVRAESFRNQVVFTVEKNRRGIGGIDIEFDRDFPHRRFSRSGGFVTERLVDNVSVHE
ncbi:MAG: DnaB-like helicase C-terminal domain-containing protein [Acidimicrobiales bacterium]